MLSPKTSYTAYLVYKLRSTAFGFGNPPPAASIGITGGQFHKQLVRLHRNERLRKDDCLETKLGEFFNEGGEDELQISLMEVEARTSKGGLFVKGIEIRPTRG